MAIIANELDARYADVVFKCTWFVDHPKKGMQEFPIQIVLHNNQLRCGMCELHWCAHVEEFIKGNQDWKLFWVHSVGHVMVPMFPNWLPDLPVLVEVAGDPKSDIRIIEWVPPGTDDLTINDDEPGTEVLCLLSKGEGMNSIRACIVDRMNSAFSMDPPHCKSKAHQFNEEITLQRSLKNTASIKLSQLWCLWCTGKCMDCSRFGSQIDDAPEPVTSGFLPQTKPTYHPPLSTRKKW